MAKITRMGTTSTTLFTNQKEVDRAIQAAVDQYEIYRNNIVVKHKRNRRSKTQAQRKLRSHRGELASS